MSPRGLEIEFEGGLAEEVTAHGGVALLVETGRRSGVMERADRVTLTGNVGRDPELRTTARGPRVLKFPLGVHEGKRTTWRDVLFFDEKAERVAGQLSKGELVTVVGYKHEREAEVKKGNQTFKKRVIEIYWALVRTPKSPNSKAAR